MKRFMLAFRLGLLALSLILPTAAAQAGPVRAVMFYSPSCPHCHVVITEHMPPILAEYGQGSVVETSPSAPGEEDVGPPVVGFMGAEFQLLYVNTSTKVGVDMFNAAVAHYDIPEDRQAVPLLIVGDSVLLGDVEIPEQLPGLIEAGLAAGGIGWPEVEGLSGALAVLEVADENQAPDAAAGQATPAGPSAGASPATESPTQSTVAPPMTEQSRSSTDGSGATDSSTPVAAGADSPPSELPPGLVTRRSWKDNYRRDPVGNSISVVVLLGMLLAVAVIGRRVRVATAVDETAWPVWLIPLLGLIGTGIAAYMSDVEINNRSAVCVVVHGCNEVQQSQYATLFGLLPVAILGLAGYIAILAAWAVTRRVQGRRSDQAAVALFGCAAFGVLFSIYLTFLEPFVIGASCIWCLSSAIVITALFWISAEPAAAAWVRLRQK